MKKFLSISIVLFLVFSKQAYSVGGWSGEATVTEIYALSDSSAVIKLSSFANPNNCKVSSAGDIWLNPEESKVWFTMILSAYMAEKKVNVYVTDECDTTHWADQSFGQIGHVRLVK